MLSSANCQFTFWSEDFNGYAEGVTTGANNNTSNPAKDWTSGGCTTCPSSVDDWWEVRSGVLEARDVNNEHVYFQTESIDISGYTSVNIHVDVLEDGDLEGLYWSTDNCLDGINQDYADVEYRVNGGAWTLVPNYLGWCGLYASCGTHTLYGDDNASGDCRTDDDDWISTTVSVLGISGSTLELRLSATNSSGVEYIRFDNIDIQYTTLLPIELLSFTAKVEDSHVELNWQTASEINNDFFTIERSSNTVTWEKVKNIKGSGNSNTIQSYNTTDPNPYQGVSYYRLKQTDFDGQVNYMPIKSVRIHKLTTESIRIYPNPVKNKITIEGSEAELNEIHVYNLLGQEVTSLTQQVIHNKTKVEIDLSKLNPGMYYLNTKNTAYKLLKQ